MRRGFTLIELMVCLGIIVILLGTGVGVYKSYTRLAALRSETAQLVAIITSVRNAAISSNGAACVRIDAQNRVYPFILHKVGVFHFEDLVDNRSFGAGSQVALAEGATPQLVPGKVGNAMLFDGALYLKAKDSAGSGWVDPVSYDSRQGIALEAWIMPASVAGKMAIVSREGWFSLAIERDEATGLYKLLGTAMVLGVDGKALAYTAATSAVIRPNEWTHVSMNCHTFGTGMQLLINGVDSINSYTSSAAAIPANAETLIGASADSDVRFSGMIDQLVIGIYENDQMYEISRKLALEKTGFADGDTVRFTGSGTLDAAHGSNPPRIVLKNLSGNDVKNRATITVGPMGVIDVETWDKK